MYTDISTVSSIWRQIWEELNNIIKTTNKILTLNKYLTINTIIRIAYRLDRKLKKKKEKLLKNIDIDNLLEKLLVYAVNFVEYSVLETLLSTCGNLICMSECNFYPQNTIKSIVAILALPWANNFGSMFKSTSHYKYLNTLSLKYSIKLSKYSIFAFSS